MHPLRAPLGAVLGLALGATAAVAAPTPTPKPPKAQDQCPAPDKATCLSDGYIDSTCGQKHLAECKDHVQKAMEDHYKKKSDTTVKMLRPKLTEMPKHVVQGKYFPYKKLAEMKKTGTHAPVGTVYRKAADPLAGIAGMDMTSKPPVDRVTKVDPNEAAKFHRNPEWKTNGAAVRSCKEYAYARSYSATRFIDAASACRGDRECVFAVAYMNGSPGIAKRKLYDEAGVLMPRQLDLPKARVPKNDMFVDGLDEFIKVPTSTFPNGLVAQSSELTALRSALRSGKDYYEIGYCSGNGCNTTRKFADVWDWHKRLHDVTIALSQAEAEEYERRRARFRALLEQWGAAVAREKSIGEGHILQQPVVLPFDMRAQDPFERYELEHEYIERGRDARTRFKQRFGPEILEVPRTQAIQKIQQKLNQQGSLPPSSATMAVGLLAAPSPKATPTSKSTPSAGARHTTPLPNVDPASWLSDGSISKCLANDGWGLEMAHEGPISCRIEEFLISEWRRKADGQSSCLDFANAGCDWTPQMFEAGILDQVQKLDVQVADESYCNAFREPNTTFGDAANNGGLAIVTVVKTRLDAMRTLIEEQLKALGPYRRTRTDKGQPLGKTWEGGDYAGDKDWFAAGYDWEVGWDVAPLEKKDGAVCKLEGSAHGEVGFDAWIVGGKIPVVQGSVWAEAKALDGDNAGKARFNAHLEMMGQSLFNTNGWKLAQTFQPDDEVGWAVKVPPGLKPRFDIYVGVPISGQMWGELMFGSTLGLGGAGPTSCSTGSPQFAVAAQYTPFFGAFGVGQVGVGIAGVASAGIRASLTLIMLGMPAELDMQVAVKDGSPTLSFSTELGLFLATLGGRVSLYVEFLMFDEEFELFRWKGFFTKVPLMPKLSADLSLVGLR